MEKLERSLSDVGNDLEQDPVESDAKPKSTKKVKKVAKAKKGAKKVAKKASKPEATEDGKIKLTELASEAGITTASARRKLRDADLNREGRWSWEDGSRDYKAARKALGLDE